MKQNDLNLFIVGLFVLAGGYLLWPASESADLSSQSVSKNIKGTINQHLKTGRLSSDLRRELTAIENKVKAPSIDLRQIDPRAYVTDEPLPLRLNSENAAAKAYRESRLPDSGRDYHAMTPDQRITRKINRDEWEREYRELASEEELRRYLERARAAGFDVRLNKKGEIVEVTEIETNEPLRFPQSVDESVKKTTSESSH